MRSLFTTKSIIDNISSISEAAKTRLTSMLQKTRYGAILVIDTLQSILKSGVQYMKDITPQPIKNAANSLFDKTTEGATWIKSASQPILNTGAHYINMITPLFVKNTGKFVLDTVYPLAKKQMA